MNSTDETTRRYMQGLNDHELSEFIRQIDATEIIAKNTIPDHKQAALWYATALAWPIFPLQPAGKQPLTQHGFKDATLDPELIQRWWTQWPTANLGIPTGSVETGGCGYDVIDVDGPAGFTSLRQLQHKDCPEHCSSNKFCEATGAMPETQALAFTPGDPKGIINERAAGRHYYSLASGSTNRAGIMPGIDLRGTGGYIVAAPSVGPSGNRYSWIRTPIRTAIA
jgi:hypothetical protein